MHSGEEPASKTALSDGSDQTTNEIQLRKKKAPHLHSNRQTVSCALLEHATVTYGKCSKSLLKNIYLHENATGQGLGFVFFVEREVCSVLKERMFYFFSPVMHFFFQCVTIRMCVCVFACEF